jgi:hypothetical protein
MINTNNPRELTSRSREVYKEEKIKIQNYASRVDRDDEDGEKVSARPASEQEAVASNSVAVDFVFSPEEVSDERGIVIAPRDVSSRYSGISVQHAITPKGIKIFVTIQKPEWAQDGLVQMATAELKRYDRMREVNAREADSEQFAHYLDNVKIQLQSSHMKEIGIGRLHLRGKRSAWIYDSLIIAFFEHKHIARVMLYLEGEEHVIEMNLPMSESQQKFYSSQGRQGTIAKSQAVPRLDDLPLTKFGGTA